MSETSEFEEVKGPSNRILSEERSDLKGRMKSNAMPPLKMQKGEFVNT